MHNASGTNDDILLNSCSTLELYRFIHILDYRSIYGGVYPLNVYYELQWL